jgi:hypothetical protein
MNGILCLNCRVMVVMGAGCIGFVLNAHLQKLNFRKKI